VRLAREFPATTFILAHWGGMLPVKDPTANARALPNVYFDTAASPLLYDAGVWSRALPAFGPDRVLFGSDFPLNLYPKQDETAGMIRFVAEARAANAGTAILRDNAARLLGITAV
jgi:predicted TIM-barrel fold metal-dependent hydrolase